MAGRRLRVLHVATLLTPDGAYGGPVRVATNQIRALRARGHDAILVAAAAGFDELPTTWDGVPVVTFPAVRAAPGAGFAGLAAPSMVRWIRACGARADVAHVHLARDLVTLPAAVAWARSGKPYVTQTHGMVMPSPHPLAAPLDAVLTRRVMARASTSFALTPVEEGGLRTLFGPGVSIQRLVNGVPAGGTSDPQPPDHHPEVLFLARLHPRKRPVAFVDAAARLAPRFPEARFRIVGPDEGEGAAVRDRIAALPAGVRGRVVWEGALPPERTTARLARASLYVLPSVDEPFPMSVLEAMSCGVPVVVTRTCGLAEPVARAAAGEVVGEGVDDLAAAVARFLDDPRLAQDAGRRARDLVRRDYSMGAVADALERAYAR
ncbi:glycosyltransferase [Cellulosimicrobium sp. NPDC055967]|uniref:glycosyltransferase n=1 Tax=Cellulosimicrobium sp. NPDC055967 TaxID=3345670 RepID=UPI0035D62B8D